MQYFLDNKKNTFTQTFVNVVIRDNSIKIYSLLKMVIIYIVIFF